LFIKYRSQRKDTTMNTIFPMLLTGLSHCPGGDNLSLCDIRLKANNVFEVKGHPLAVTEIVKAEDRVTI